MKKAIRIATNKYVLTLTVFVVWVAYFDKNDWFAQKEREQDLVEVKQNIAYLKSEIADMKKQRDGIKNDPAVLEKYAREHYHMKRNNEDVFVFE